LSPVIVCDLCPPHHKIPEISFEAGKEFAGEIRHYLAGVPSVVLLESVGGGSCANTGNARKETSSNNL
jgi:hypothetical protein